MSSRAEVDCAIANINARSVDSGSVRVRQGPHRAIKTEYKYPTDHRGSRVIATVLGTGKRFVAPWDHALGSLENHDAAAVEACRRMAWGGELVGARVSGEGYIYVLC